MEMGVGVLEERQKVLTEMVIASLMSSPNYVTAADFLDLNDIHPKYREVYEKIRGGGSGADAFEAAYNSSENLRKLLEDYEKVTQDEFVSIAYTLQGVSRRADALRRLAEVTDRIGDLSREQLLDRLSETADLFKSRTSSYSTGDKVHMSSYGKKVSTGYPLLDRETGGIGKGDLAVLAARPSMGKTAFALNMSTRMIFSGKSVLFNSLETPPHHLIMRMAALLAGVSMFKALNMSADDVEKVRLAAALSLISLHAHRFAIIEDPTPAGMSTAVQRFCPDVAFVDHLQIMDGRGQGRTEAMTNISKAMKEIAKMAPVIALSQLNRGAEARQDRRPSLIDLRESGSIEQDADLVMFLYREAAYNTTQENVFNATIDIAKQRNGPTGEIPIRFVAPFGLFV